MPCEEITVEAAPVGTIFALAFLTEGLTEYLLAGPFTRRG